MVGLCHITLHFEIRTTFDHSYTRLVCNSDPHISNDSVNKMSGIQVMTIFYFRLHFRSLQPLPRLVNGGQAVPTSFQPDSTAWPSAGVSNQPLTKRTASRSRTKRRKRKTRGSRYQIRDHSLMTSRKYDPKLIPLPLCHGPLYYALC